jgi:PKD repeat protein
VGVTSTGGGTPVVRHVTVDFGDGSTPAQLGEISGNTPVQHLFAGSGALTMKITATDPDGQTTSIQSPVVVAPLSAVGVANPTSVALGGSILFTVTPTTGALIDHYVWDFGEGDPPFNSVSNAQAHVYLTKGGHTATITVVPQVGPSFTLTVPIVIN